jgi:proteasome accessory factor A
LLDADELPTVVLADAVTTLRQLSRTLKPPWRVTLADGKTADALELLDGFRLKARQQFKGRDAETDAILDLWEWTQEMLAADTSALVGILDWVSKEFLLRKFCESEGLPWGNSWLESQDLEFHQIDPDKSLGLAIANMDGFWAPPRQLQARIEPPTNSRAHARSKLMREIMGKETSYFLDWEAVEVPNQKRTRLLDPFQP